MQVTETSSDGLKREYKVVVNAAELDQELNAKLKELSAKANIKGFRPGKVPPNLIRKMHGDALQRDALNGAVQDGVQQMLEEQKVRPAVQPEVVLDARYEPGQDAEVQVRLEALPDVPSPQIDGLDQLRRECRCEHRLAPGQGWPGPPPRPRDPRPSMPSVAESRRRSRTDRSCRRGSRDSANESRTCRGRRGRG